MIHHGKDYFDNDGWYHLDGPSWADEVARWRDSEHDDIAIHPQWEQAKWSMKLLKTD